MRDAEISIRNQTLRLLPERAIYWVDAEALLVADIHIGKAAAFRAASIPIPTGTTSADLIRLTSAVERTGARTLYVLGDLYHARSGMAAKTLRVWMIWLDEHAGVDVHVIAGNHDLRAGRPELNHPVRYAAEHIDVGPFRLTHYPVASHDRYTLAGHLHPGIVLGSRGGDRIRVPCYHFSADVGVLPAFGSFTGLYPIEPCESDHIFAVTDNEVIQVG